MRIELGSPCCLLLGVAPVAGRLAQIGIALQHPPVHLEARASAFLSVTGGRADLAARQAARVLEHHGLPQAGEIAIELAIPSFMGLGSAGMLGLSVARALAALHGLPADDPAALARAAGLAPEEALEAHAFAAGGLLAVGPDGQMLRRRAIAHGEDHDWVFVFVLPRVPVGTPETLEADRRRALLAASEQHQAAAEGAASELWRAAERDDFAAFARAVAELQEANLAALAAAGQPSTLAPDERAVLDIMREQGALAWGRSPTGLGLFGLIQGAGPSRAVRRALQQHLGFFGGTVMATISDNQGARHTTSTD